MLRISLVEAPDQAVTIRLEGQVRRPWVDELRRSCEHWLAKGKALHLDLSEVSFIDMEGVALCHRLRARQVEILANGVAQGTHFALDIGRIQLYKGVSHCSGRLVRHHADPDESLSAAHGP